MISPKLPEEPVRRARRMPAQSIFYNRIVPIVLIGLGLVMIALIVTAVGVLIGYIHYQ